MNHLITSQKSLAEGLVETLPGLGDNAVFAVLLNRKDAHEYSLNVLKGGNKYIEVDLFDFTSPEQARNIAVALARTAIANYESGAYKQRVQLNFEKD